MFNRKDNDNKKTILEENQRLKPVLFFGFYLIFFIVLILLLRSGYKNNNASTNPKKSGYGYDYKLNRILNENYHFVYTEEMNTEKTIFEGDWLDNTLSYRKSGVVSSEYYQNRDKVYLKDPNSLTWSETENPMIFSKVANPSTLKRIITSAAYVSKTDYIKSDTKSFNYEIETSYLYKMFNDDTNEFDNVPTNKIIVTIEENGKIKSIQLDLTNYYNIINPEITNYKLTFTYSKYGEIEEIPNPIG